MPDRLSCKHCEEPIERGPGGQWVHVRTGIGRAWCNGLPERQAEPETAPNRE